MLEVPMAPGRSNMLPTVGLHYTYQVPDLHYPNGTDKTATLSSGCLPD